ncbi:flagellar protein YvyF [Halobacillus salinarum]|uniref:Flagellar protein YvyF n=1 Tax=Halobacillus salinarum TaxID=2932257 RepID=A0ABY4EPD2_9BACI|nr:TIGR03826 family flagellar region protein [Halobacillus salinarum]UOQ45723.1 flagellar protein YvyF [Halobacillus salinarum]
MGELANCPRCKELFLKGTAEVCQNCRRLEEEDFQKVYAFIRKKSNRTATVMDIVEETGVEEQLIRKFVKQRRLHPAEFPGLSYPCEKCGAEIQEDRLCKNCIDELVSGIKHHERMEKGLERRKQQELKKGLTYYSVNNQKKY